MSDFADTEDDDAVDESAPDADPEQVAILLQEVRVQLAEADGLPLLHWHELEEHERQRNVAVVLAVVAILRREGTRL